MKKKLAFLLCFSLMIALLAGGCQNSSAKKPVVPSPKKPNQTEQNKEMTSGERRVLVSKLSRTAEELEGVEKATVVIADVGIANNITGNSKTKSPAESSTSQKLDDNIKGDPFIDQKEPQGMIVMVGLTLRSDKTLGTDMDKSMQIESRVRDKLKASDSRISQVLVTTDPNLVKRLTDVAAGILEGKPIKTFEKDIKNIDSSLRKQESAF